MSRILAVVITYFPEEEQLCRNISSFIDDVDGILIWENTPADQAPKYRFVQNPKIIYMGEGNNVGIAKAFNLALSYATDKGYEYMMTMDQDSSWGNFSWYKSAIVDNFSMPNALFGPEREIQPSKIEDFKSTIDRNTTIVLHKVIHQKNTQIVDNFEKNVDKSESCEQIKLVKNMSLINSGMLAKTAVLNQLGGYWKQLFVDGIDEELMCRAKSMGIDAYLVQGAVFHHKLGYPVKKKFFGKEYTVPGYSKERLYDRFRSIYMIRRKYPEMTEVNDRLEEDWLKNAPLRILMGADHRFAKLWAIIKGTHDGKHASIDR